MHTVIDLDEYVQSEFGHELHPWRAWARHVGINPDNAHRYANRGYQYVNGQLMLPAKIKINRNKLSHNDD